MRNSLTNSPTSPQIQESISLDQNNNISYIEKIHLALESSKVLDPIHLEVTDESLWYAHRHQLGPKKHGQIIVKQVVNTEYGPTSALSTNALPSLTPAGVKYESFIYRMKRIGEDLELKPVKVSAGFSSSKLGAYRLAEKLQKERDGCEIESDNLIYDSYTNTFIEKELSDLAHKNIFYQRKKNKKHFISHIKIFLVSKKFYRIDNFHRILLVYTELLNLIGEPLIYSKDIGKNYAALPIFLSLPPDEDIDGTKAYFSPQIIFQLLTPSQWDSKLYPPIMTERYGPSHNFLQNLGIDSSATFKEQKDRVKLIVDSEPMPIEEKDKPKKQITTKKLDKNTKKLNTSIKKLSTTSATKSNNDKDKLNNAHMSQTQKIEKKANEISELVEANKKLHHSNSTSSISTVSTDVQSSYTSLDFVKETPLSDSLGISQNLSKVKYDKIGGIFGHFFHDISSEIREKILMKYKDNEELLLAVMQAGDASLVNRDLIASNLPLSKVIKKKAKVGKVVENSKTKRLEVVFDEDFDKNKFQPKTNLSKLKEKALANDIGSSYNISNKEDTEMELKNNFHYKILILKNVIIRLQRIYKLNKFLKIKKYYYKLYKSIIIIQKFIRKVIQKKFYLIYKKLKPIAIKKIKNFFISIKKNYIIKKFKTIVYYLINKTLPLIKKFILKCYKKWINKRNYFANIIIKYIRRYIIKNRIIKFYSFQYNFFYLYHHNVIIIQKNVRRYLIQKKFFPEYKKKILNYFIILPCVLRVQRVVRNYLSRIIYKKKKHFYDQIIKVQYFIRKFLLLKKKKLLALEVILFFDNFYFLFSIILLFFIFLEIEKIFCNKNPKNLSFLF